MNTATESMIDTPHVFSFSPVARKMPKHSKVLLAQLGILIAGFITVIISLFNEMAVIGIFPLALLFIAISISNLPSNLKGKIPFEC